MILKFNKIKTVGPQTNENRVLKPKVLHDAGDLFSELYYIYRDKYSEEKYGFNTKNQKKKIYCKKSRLTDDYQYEPEEEEKEEEMEQQTSKKPNKKELPKKPTKDDLSEFNEWVNRKGINPELFKKHFHFQRPSYMLKVVYTTNDKKKNSKPVNVIKSGLNDLKNEIEGMGEEEEEIEKPNEIIDIAEKILKFNKQNQSGQGLKILTPDQMLSRLPITLAQLKAGNNSQKLINEIMQLLYSMYHQKKPQNNL